MYSMTESKVIQQADQNEEFQQNPHYFHRNVDRAEISHDIDFISKDVNAFISKLKNTNSHAKYIPKFSPSSETLSSNYIGKQYRIQKPKSQIDQITSNTQSLIQDLSWMNTVKNIHRKSTFNEDDTHSIVLGSQTSVMNRVERNQTKRSKNINSSQKIPMKNTEKTLPLSNSKSIDVNRARFQRSSKDCFPKTFDVFSKSFNQQKIADNHKVNNRNKIYFQNNKNVDLLQQFDDKDTVVNELQSNGRRKYSKVKVKTQLQRQVKKEQNSEKLTKKKLLQKILKLENSFLQFKNEPYNNNRIVYSRQNQALVQNPDLKKKHSFVQEFDAQLNNKFRPKFSLNEKISQIQNIQMSQKKTTVNHIENYNRFNDTVPQSTEKFSLISSSTKKFSKTKNVKDSKISLTEWTSEVWLNDS